MRPGVQLVTAAWLGFGAGAACRVETEITPVDTSTTGGSSGSGSDAGTGSTAVSSDGSGDGSTGTGTGGAVDPGPWAPGVVFPSTREPDARGFVDLRGLVHTHSPFSHDACDGEPRDADGNLDAMCVEDLRRGLCQVQHDFVFLTDHRESFSDSEFPDVLLYDADRGDTLVDRGVGPVASWASCDDAAVRPTLLMAGCEVGGSLMSVGLERHAPGRGATYGDLSPAGIAEVASVGGLAFVAHPEDFDAQELIDLPLDGFEMYNLHANFIANIAPALVLLSQVETPELLPHSDLLLMPIWQEDPRYVERWGTVLAAGMRRVTTMATDAHRNTLPDLLPDGERADSFRRMMLWFSNHVRVQPEADGTFDDRHVKEALRAGRLYGAFEYMGYPEGFDARIEVGGEVHEIGDEVALADGPEIVVVAPTVRELDPAVTPPETELRVLRARDGGFDEVAVTTEDELRYAPDEPGAYRVEVRIAPHHLVDWLGSYGDLADQWRPWIYANPFYVTGP